MALTKVKSEQLDAAQTSITSVGTLTGLTVSGDLTVDTSTFVVDATNNRIGIGTTSPADALHILDTSGHAYASVARSTQSQGEVGLRLRGGTSGNDWYIYQKPSNNNLNFYNTSDRMTIDSSGNVGIGTTPSGFLTTGYVLRLFGGSQTLLTFNNSTHTTQATGGFVIGNDGSNAYIVQRENQPLDFYTNDLFRMRIDSSGNVGIDTSSPYTYGKFAIRGGITVSAGSTSLTGTSFSTSDAANSTFWINHASATTNLVSDSPMAFFGPSGSGVAERMRIDASGNVGIGNSGVASTRLAVTNSVVGANIETTSSNAGHEGLIVNRQNSDGTAIAINRAGTTVGSIGVLNSNNLRITGDVADHGGLQFGTHSVVPMEAGSDSDGTIDLGASAARFKDLYLSGGAYLGGTAAANKLDDYEEGTWTPTIQGNSGATGQSYAGQAGRFTKVGSFVHYTFDVTLSALGTLLGHYVVIGGLPFPGNSGNIGGSANIGYHTGTAGNLPLGAYIGGSNVYLMEQGISGSDYMLISENKIGNSGRLIGSLLVHTPN